MIEKVCAACAHLEPYVPSAWFEHIFFLYQLSAAGYPFAEDSLDIEEWLDLGAMKNEMEALKVIPRG